MRSIGLKSGAVFLFLQIGATGSVALAGDDLNSGQSYYAGLTCGQLWYERNKIFASRGHCFSTRQGRNAFPNSCFPPYGKLPNHLKRTVSLIKKWERRRGC